jgi:hypothetical protein
MERGFIPSLGVGVLLKFSAIDIAWIVRQLLFHAREAWSLNEVWQAV